MTQKELSYFEDAIGHEANIIKIVSDMINKLTDDNLISFMNNELEKHNNLKSDLMNILGEKANG